MLKRQSQYHDHIAAVKAVAYLLILMGTIILLPLLMLFFPAYRGEFSHAVWFIFPGVLSFFAGYILKFITSGTRIRKLKDFYGSIIVLELWIIAVLVGCIPFMMSGEFTFTQAVFETMSGLTTTGFTLFPYEHAASLQMLILYRSLLHLVGGVGLVLVLSTILFNAYNMQIFSAEGHTDRLAPSPLHSARTILFIYLGFIIGGTIAFAILGMSWFNAFNYSISAIATGGFAPHADSIGHYHSVLAPWRAYGIDIVACILMLLGGTNFMASMFFLKGRWRGFFRHSEVRCTFILLLLSIPVVVADYIVRHECISVGQDIASAAFLVISTISTTGLSTVHNSLPNLSFGIVPILLLMMVGAHSDSTAGGIKASRTALAFKSLYWDVRSTINSNHFVHPQQIYRFGSPVKVTDKDKSQNLTYILIYISIVVVGTIGLMACGYPFRESLVEFASALGTIGLSIGVVSRACSAPALWIIIVGMLIARLEIYIFIFAATRIRRDIMDFRRDLYLTHEDSKARKKARREHQLKQKQEKEL